MLSRFLTHPGRYIGIGPQAHRCAGLSVVVVQIGFQHSRLALPVLRTLTVWAHGPFKQALFVEGETDVSGGVFGVTEIDQGDAQANE